MTTRAPIKRPTSAEEELAMYESNDFDRLDEHMTFDHPSSCGCRECDPDFYFDPAERDAGRPDPERRRPS